MPFFKRCPYMFCCKQVWSRVQLEMNYGTAVIHYKVLLRLPVGQSLLILRHSCRGCEQEILDSWDMTQQSVFWWDNIIKRLLAIFIYSFAWAPVSLFALLQRWTRDWIRLRNKQQKVNLLSQPNWQSIFTSCLLYQLAPSPQPNLSC